MIAVILAEDQVLLREGLARLFADFGHEVTAALGDVTELVAGTVPYDPPAWYSGSGSDMENYLGEPLASLMLGAASPQATYDQMIGSLHTLSKEPVPV